MNLKNAEVYNRKSPPAIAEGLLSRHFERREKSSE